MTLKQQVKHTLVIYLKCSNPICKMSPIKSRNLKISKVKNHNVKQYAKMTIYKIIQNNKPKHH